MKGLFFVLLSVALGRIAVRFGVSFWLLLAAVAAALLGIHEWVREARREKRFFSRRSGA